MDNFRRIQYISDGIDFKDQLQNIKNALDNGISWVQLRWKTYKNGTELFQLAQATKKLCDAYNATFIVNDHLFLAKEMDADGIHLGLNDASIPSAKSYLGNSKIIGGTANTFENILQRCNENCSYIGLGPMRFTKTKQKLSPILGIEGYATLLRKLMEDKITVPPIYAIGGIVEHDIPELIEIGVFGVAVSSIIQENPDTIIKLKKYYEKYLENSGSNF